MVTCCCSAVVDVTIMRPDLKFQLGFSVKEGNVSSTTTTITDLLYLLDVV